MFVGAFYRFVPLPDFRELRVPITEKLGELGVLGTLLLAAEGFNGGFWGSKELIQLALDTLAEDDRFEGILPRYTPAEIAPFHRLRVRPKKEIVMLRRDVKMELVGEYVGPDRWNELLDDPEVVVLDTRNDYECEVGRFPGSIDPRTTMFNEFPKFVEENLDPSTTKKVAMYCTGGIRCEKATALLREMGFEHVYHLQGGIHGYLEQVAPEANRWEGECFVFDDRRGV